MKMIFTACLFFYRAGPRQPNRENESLFGA
jgi:hypothetical protein